MPQGRTGPARIRPGSGPGPARYRTRSAHSLSLKAAWQARHRHVPRASKTGTRAGPPARKATVAPTGRDRRRVSALAAASDWKCAQG